MTIKSSSKSKQRGREIHTCITQKKNTYKVESEEHFSFFVNKKKKKRSILHSFIVFVFVF